MDGKVECIALWHMLISVVYCCIANYTSLCIDIVRKVTFKSIALLLKKATNCVTKL